MATMDLSVNQELIRVQRRYDGEYGNDVFKLQEAFQETDITGNNNFFNSLKTETTENHVCNPNPKYQVKCNNDNDLVVENSLFSYSSFRRAMDLRIHNRTEEGGRRTIFEDAEYFARNCCYKLLPISFEQVDESIIHTEHNYSLFSLESESETGENCSRTMDFSQVREKNYKKRKTKICENSDHEEGEVDGKCEEDSFRAAGEVSPSQTCAGQPLDLSAPPEVQLNKTEPLASVPEEAAQADSDKENAGGGLSGIKVTITRPDEKGSYQPCDLFLNDIARLVPWLIDKDCSEVDILDRTCDRHRDFRKHRLYYVISESTWRFFQSTNERIILTNDRSLGQPLRRAEREDRPSYLVFDQFSLAKCLAEYCQEIGGSFEYTCVEEGRERAVETAEERANRRGGVVDAEENRGEAEKQAGEERTEKREAAVDVEEIVESVKKGDFSREEQEVDVREKENKGSAEAIAPVENVEIGNSEVVKVSKGGSAKERTKRNSIVSEKVKKNLGKLSSSKAPQKVGVEKKIKMEASGSKGKKERAASVEKSRQKPRGPEDLLRITRSKYTSEVETSQTSDKRVSRKESEKRRQVVPPTDEPPSKRKRTPKPEEVTVRNRRSLTASSEAKRATTSKEKPEKKEKKVGKEKKAREIVEIERRLRSQGTRGREREKRKRKVEKKKMEKGNEKEKEKGKKGEMVKGKAVYYGKSRRR